MTGWMCIGKVDEHFIIQMATILHAPQNSTWNRKMMVSKRNLLSPRKIFRFHVTLQGCRQGPNLPPKKKSCSTSDPIFSLFSEGTAFQK